MGIGCWGNATAGEQSNMEGHMADVYFIDGQALEPTAFGRTNEQGVWVPREVDFTPAEMRNSDFLFGATNGTYNARLRQLGFLTQAFHLLMLLITINQQNALEMALIGPSQSVIVYTRNTYENVTGLDGQLQATLVVTLPIGL